MEQATYKIGEAANLLNLKTYVLRFWETEFSQISPLRTEKGQRLYTESDLALLKRIRYLLHDRGLTIEGARRILFEESSKYTHPSVTTTSSTIFLFDGPKGIENSSEGEGSFKKHTLPKEKISNPAGKEGEGSSHKQPPSGYALPKKGSTRSLDKGRPKNVFSRQSIINELEEIATVLRGIRQIGKYLQ